MQTNSAGSVEKVGMRAVLGQWLVLLRAPNLFTIPGDILAGAFLSAGFSGRSFPYRVLPLIGSSLLLYSAGVILNDWFDIEHDRRSRPERPLAAGRISTRSAMIAAVSLLAAALGLAAAAGRGPLTVAAVIAVFVVFYNGAARRVPLLKFVTMGLCRGANLLLGASIALPALSSKVLTAAVIEGCYIATVSAIAAGETQGPPRPLVRFAPPFAIAAGLAFLTIRAGVSIQGVMACTVAVLSVFFIVLSMPRDLPASEMPKKIGALICALIPIQAAFILLGAPRGALVGAALVYALWPATCLAGLRIRGS